MSSKSTKKTGSTRKDVLDASVIRQLFDRLIDIAPNGVRNIEIDPAKMMYEDWALVGEDLRVGTKQCAHELKADDKIDASEYEELVEA